MTTAAKTKVRLVHRRNELLVHDFDSEKDAKAHAEKEKWTIVGEKEDLDDEGRKIIYYLP